MEEWKVVYSQNGITKVTDWSVEKTARKIFESLKNEKVLLTEWAELVYSPVDDDAEDSEKVIEQFTRKKTELFGKTVLL